MGIGATSCENESVTSQLKTKASMKKEMRFAKVPEEKACLGIFVVKGQKIPLPLYTVFSGFLPAQFFFFSSQTLCKHEYIVTNIEYVSNDFKSLFHGSRTCPLRDQYNWWHPCGHFGRFVFKKRFLKRSDPNNYILSIMDRLKSLTFVWFKESFGKVYCLSIGSNMQELLFQIQLKKVGGN